MDISRWLRGNRDAGDRGCDDAAAPKLARVPTTSTCDSTSSTASRHVEYSEDWEEELRMAMEDMGHGDGTIVLVTDIIGTDVHFKNGEVTGHCLAQDRFPLRLTPTPSRSRSCSASETSSVCSSRSSWRSSDSSAPKPAAAKGPRPNHANHVALEVGLTEVWPIVLQRKIHQLGVHPNQMFGDIGESYVTTDAQGRVLNLTGDKVRLLTLDQFPLKLVFSFAEEGVEPVHSSKHTCNNDEVRYRSADRSAAVQHSIEIPVESILMDVVDAKLEEMNLQLDNSSRCCALVTDRLGVLVNVAESIPDRKRFPLRVHIERKFLTDIQPAQPTRWLSFPDKDYNILSDFRTALRTNRAWKTVKKIGNVMASHQQR